MSISDDQNTRGESISKAEDQNRAVAGFERLWVWQKAHALMIEVHNICKRLPRQERFRLRDQLERSSSSVVDNIAEGHTSYYYQEKIKGFHTARKEVGEVQNHMRSLQGKGYVTKKIADEFISKYEEVIRGINGYINWVRKKKGTKK
ncbi:MAG: four helix bundle protein [candidate division WOR-3 bacterium]|nr:MAG: four helix bundle protein [candidate division WOR-3 bacterium]